MKIASYNLHSIETGEFALDGGAMFGIVPKALWSKKIPSDKQNRILLRMRSLLIRSDKKNILIDTGIGDKEEDKFNEIYKINLTKYNIKKSLKKHNLSLNDITDVIITHLHFDHAGGLTTKNHTGNIILTFPNATHYIQKKHLEAAKKPNLKDKGSFFESTFKPLLKSGQIKIINGSKKIFPNIETIIVNGHTEAQQIVKISDKKNTLIYCADLIPTSAHISLPWIMAYDNKPLITIKEKKNLLNKASANKWILFFEHCPIITACIPEKTLKGFVCGKNIYF